MLELAARTERLPADDPERQVEGLRQFQKVAVFTVALADLTGRLPLMKVSDRLTDIAELIVQRCMDLAWQQMTDVYGVPYCGDERGAPAPGARRRRRLRQARRLGAGLQLGSRFGFPARFERRNSADQRPRVRSTTASFSCDLGQRIVHLLTMHSAAGRLYEVDMRLRPNGKGGFLMTGIDAFERYQRQDAWTWEHQALLRARSVAGDAALREAFEAVRRRILCDRRAPRHPAHRRAGDAPAHAARTIARPVPGSSTSSRTRAASPTSSFWCNTGCWRPPGASRVADLFGQYPATRGIGRGGRARRRRGRAGSPIPTSPTARCCITSPSKARGSGCWRPHPTPTPARAW